MNKHTWHKKTDAKIISTVSRLRKLICEQKGIAIGLAGFSGSFSKNPRSDAEDVTERVLVSMLNQKIESAAGAPIFLVSGATNLGVPRVGYSVANQLSCKTVGVTAGSAIRYSIARLDYLTIVGKKFGDESEAFVSILDELWIIGGGPQSKNEFHLAIEKQTPVVVFQGIGGIADELSPDSIQATFVSIDQFLSTNGD